MRTISITIVALAVFLLPMVASAQVVEESLGRVKDRPPCLGFFVPDGGKPVPCVLVDRSIGYCLMFSQEQTSSIDESTEGYFCLPPYFYHGAVDGLEQRGPLMFIPVDPDALNITDARAADYEAIDLIQLQYMYAVVAESASLADNGNIRINYRLFPVKESGSGYRITNFLYTKEVPRGYYPMFGRTVQDDSIVFLGYLNVSGKNFGEVVGVDLAEEGGGR